jgi:hypothetical protein
VPEEALFRDVHPTKQMPLIALQGAYKGYYDDAVAIVWIEHHLTFIDPNNMVKIVNHVTNMQK